MTNIPVKSWALTLCICWIGLLLVIGNSAVCAQEGMQIDSRVVKKYVRPVLPETARRMGLKGLVKVEAVVAPSGRVTAVRPIGGHPLLVESAMLAVKAWVFNPGPQETRSTISMNFQ